MISNVPVWGFPSKGIDFTSVGYASNIGTFTLAWLGCPTDGCDPGQFVCQENADGSIEIGANAGNSALRALMSTATSSAGFPGATPGQSIAGCATSTLPSLNTKSVVHRPLIY